MKKTVATKRLYKYTVFQRQDEEASHPRIVWEAIKGKFPENHWRRKMSISTIEVIAEDMDKAVLQAKQKQGLEALLKRINQRTTSG